jgi:hypothetical protein
MKTKQAKYSGEYYKPSNKLSPTRIVIMGAILLALTSFLFMATTGVALADDLPLESGSTVRVNASSGIAVGAEADAARWVALGERYSAKAVGAELGEAANVARWNAMGERYSSTHFEAERSEAANTARWNAIGERYSAIALDAELSAAASIARWNAMGGFYEDVANAQLARSQAASVARWQAAGEHYGIGSPATGQELDSDTARWVAMGEAYQKAGLVGDRQ